MKAFFASVWGKLIAALTVITVLGGIGAEVVAGWAGGNQAHIAQITADYANLKQQADADAAKFQADVDAQAALNAKERANAESSEVAYQTEVQGEIARNAEIRKQAESDLERAKADFEQATSVYARQQADAEARKIEAQLAEEQAGLEMTRSLVLKCLRPCAQQHPHDGGYAECYTGCSMDVMR